MFLNALNQLILGEILENSIVNHCQYVALSLLYCAKIPWLIIAKMSLSLFCIVR